MHKLLPRSAKAVAGKRFRPERRRDPILTAAEEVAALAATTDSAAEAILGIAEAVLFDIDSLRSMPIPDAANGVLSAMERRLTLLFEACGFGALTNHPSIYGAVDAVGPGLDLREEIALEFRD
ncbi:MAG: hypothetical protein HYR63_00825 [Proteobacteria bacterium]|nr:hypothetical protein [Pseudomonadota bacterium]